MPCTRPYKHTFPLWPVGLPRSKVQARSPCSIHSLLLKPIIGSLPCKPSCLLVFLPFYRPTCASVLSGHIDSVTVAAIICHAPGFEALRVIVVCLYRTTSHALQDCSRQTPSQAACLLRFLLLTNVLFCIPLPLPPLFHPFVRLSF